MDSNPSTEEGKEQEDQESNFFVKKQNEELKKANKELWKRVEELQKEKTSFAEENAKLKLEIDQSQSLPGNNSILESLPRPLYMSILILQVRVSRSKLRARREEPVPVLRTRCSGGI